MVLLAMDHPRMAFHTHPHLAQELQDPADPVPIRVLTQDLRAKARLTEDRCRIRDLLTRVHPTEDHHARDRLPMVFRPRALPAKGLLTKDLLGTDLPMLLLIVELPLLMDLHAGPFPMGLTRLALTLVLMVLHMDLPALCVLAFVAPLFKDLPVKALRMAAPHRFLRPTSRFLNSQVGLHLFPRPTSHYLSNQA